MMKLTLRIIQGTDDPEMIWRDMHEMQRVFADELRHRTHQVEEMLVWWKSGHKDQTSYDVDAQIRRWSIRRLKAKRLAKRLAEGD